MVLRRGHNGRVRSVIWSPDDQRVVTAGADGAVYEWRLQDFKREKENVLKVRSQGARCHRPIALGLNYPQRSAVPQCLGGASVLAALPCLH